MKKNHEAFTQNQSALIQRLSPDCSFFRSDLTRGPHALRGVSFACDKIVEALHAESIIARKYFWPACHRMESCRTMQPEGWKKLPETEHVAARVIVLPTGQSVSEETVRSVCEVIKRACLKVS